ncbi:hypothetical protein H2200_009247 [Cladophialophora chaetospira]|uniref:Uncharacterized protein n=1 Tax=Cladophialophora chaetospira TaxID=386627 RepID=A0AA38X3Y5_9EURO|nr:hypothetical protein H2200_009247 [Cladophialophora chaetospira]
MGRQSHLARLALGRSPFDPPLQDEHGEFILGPNAQHDTRRDYVQDFDSRGHPRNIASQISRRRLLRAQNEALSTVGVVVRKAKANRTRWQSMTDQAKFELVVEENTTGAYLGIAESILQKLSTHWILNFRRRVLTYKSHVGLPIPHLILSEWNTIGPRTFLFAGLVPSAISRVSRYVRTAITEEDPFSKRPSRSSSLSQQLQIVRSLRYASLQMFWFALEYPFYAYSVLQALYLLPAGFSPSLIPSIPFKDVLSPATNPPNWNNNTWSSLAFFMLRDFRHPFVLALLRDRISSVLFPKIYVWIREILVKPNRPDGVSLQSASAQLHVVPGKITSGTARRLPRGERTVKGLLGRWLSNVLWFSLTILHTQRVAMAIELSPEIEEELLERSNVHYHELARHDRARGIRRSSRTLRVMSIRAAFHDFNLDPDSSMVDIFELADEMSLSGSSRASTSTPDPRDLPTQESRSQRRGERLWSPDDESEREWVVYRPTQDVVEQEEIGSTRSPPQNPFADGPREFIEGTTFTEPQAIDMVNPVADSVDAQVQSFLDAISPTEIVPEPAVTGLEVPLLPRSASTARLSDIVELPAEPAETQDATPIENGAPAAIEPPDQNSRNENPEDVTAVADPAITTVVEPPRVDVTEAAQHAPYQPAVPLETLLEPAPPGVEDEIILDPLILDHTSRPGTPSDQFHRPRRWPHSPTPSSPDRLGFVSPAPSFRGISRAPRLPAVTPLRPLRRPTISDQHVPTFREEVARRARENDQRSERDVGANDKVNTYRVTILSNHAAEAFAYHATSLIEALVLLPLDIMFTRSLAANFLARATTPLLTNAEGRPLTSDIWPVMGGFTVVQSLHLCGKFFVTVGAQGLINLGVWAMGTAVTLRFGEWFGWGRV